MGQCRVGPCLQTNAHILSKQVICDHKVFKLQRYSPCQSKNSNFRGVEESNFNKQPNFASNFFSLSDLVIKLLNLLFSEVPHDISAQSDLSKELWVSISKGLKHLNTVLTKLLLAQFNNSREGGILASFRAIPISLQLHRFTLHNHCSLFNDIYQICCQAASRKACNQWGFCLVQSLTFAWPGAKQACFAE